MFLTPLIQLKKFSDVPVYTREEHRGSRHNSRRAPFFPPHLEMRVLLRQQKGSPRSHHNSKGTPRFLPQLQKNQEIITSTQDEALFCCSVLREIPPSLLSLERVLDTLDATEEILRHTRLHSTGKPRFPPQLEKRPAFPSSS